MYAAKLHDAPASFSAFVDQLTPRQMASDNHFRLQRTFCQLLPIEGAKRGRPPPVLPTVHFVVRMSAPDFHERLDDVFQFVGVDPALRRRFLPVRSNAAHRTGASATVRKVCTRRTARRAVQLYRADYEAFSLPLPRWLGLGSVNLSELIADTGH